MFISNHISPPEELSSDLSAIDPDYDATKLACFVYMSHLFDNIKEGSGKIRNVHALVVDVAEEIFAPMPSDGLNKLFQGWMRRKILDILWNTSTKE